MSEKFIISIMSRDRVGIIYEVSQALSELGGNIADVRQSVLNGYFTMILLAAFPSEVNQRAIERKLAEVDARSETPIESVVRPAEPETIAAFAPLPKDSYVLTAIGTDQPGIVATVASFCVRHQINIFDLSTTVSHGDYVMILRIDLRGCPNPVREVRQDLQTFAARAGLKMTLQHHDIFRAVNEINLPVSRPEKPQ